MADLSKLRSLKDAASKTGAVARVFAALVGGSLNQRVIVLLGLCAVVYALYVMVVQLWTPLIIGVVGGVIVAMAVKDFERNNGRST